MNGNSQLYRQEIKISINHGSLSRLNSDLFVVFFTLIAALCSQKYKQLNLWTKLQYAKNHIDEVIIFYQTMQLMPAIVLTQIIL